MNNYIEEAIAALLMGKHALPYVRSNAVDDIAVKLKDMWSGVYLVEGRPGIGKSAAMKYLSTVVDARNPGRVVSYYFSLKDPVLDNAENFYSYACEKIRILVNGDSGEQTAAAKYARKDQADFHRAIFELSASIGGDVERRVYVFIDGIEEMQGYKEFLWRLPYAEGIVYAIFAQQGVCDGAFADRFYEKGKIKNKVELKYCDRVQAKLLFWEVFGKDADSSMDEFESRVATHLESYIGTEENRYPLLLKFLAEDAAKRDGFNPDRAWANGLEKYVDERVSRLAEDNERNLNAQNILALAVLAHGPLQQEDFCEILGLKPAICEAALKDAKKFLIFGGKGIVISHNVLASLISQKWTSKASHEAYLNWCANWQNPKLRPSAAEYFARYYPFHVLDFAETQPDGHKRAEELLLTLYRGDAQFVAQFVGFQIDTLRPLGESWTDIIGLNKKIFVHVSRARGYRAELITSLLIVIGQLEGERRTDHLRELALMEVELAKYKETGEKSEKLEDFIESTLAMEGLDPIGIKQDLKVISGLDKEWGEGEFLSRTFRTSRKVFS